MSSLLAIVSDLDFVKTSVVFSKISIFLNMQDLLSDGQESNSLYAYV